MSEPCAADLAQPIPCPEVGYSCPCCDKSEFLNYRIKQDEYVCNDCGLVSTVNEVVEHGRELRQKGETSDIETAARPNSD